jgi:hypothetical protein
VDGPGGAVSWIADIASIGSLAVSGYVAWQVQGIKARFIRRFAVDTFIEQLRGHNAILTSFLVSTVSDSMALTTELAKCEANLRSALHHLDGIANRDARQALRLLKGDRLRDLNAIYVAMVRLLQSLENAIAEQEARSYVE